ncbi:MAG: alpha-amylase family glycosyl hydrolase [Gilvibacter sp.]
MQETATQVALPSINDSILESAIIYEANIRQYSPEGSFNAFTKDIPQLKELGVKIIWLMPVYPISSKNRKAYGNLMAHDIEDPKEREKFLGSYYAIADYKGINPEFGTLEDFRTLVQTAHDNNMYVILDWVANHTGWDHHWITEHPEFYTKNEQGEISEPLKDDGRTPEGWSDVADLDFNNQELRQAMIGEMLYWLQEENIDGFRCDVASFVPVDFWQQAIPKLRAQKDIYMLAESDDPALLQPGLFDTAYGWASHHLLNDIAAGKNNAESYAYHLNEQFEKYGDGVLMNFVDNHDENSWNGTFFSRAGHNWEAMLALSYAAPGMPLIYSGLEYDLNHSLKFFEKDSIPKQKGKIWPVLEKLGNAKRSIPALEGSKNAASFEFVQTSMTDQIIAFKRTKGDSEVLYFANFTEDSLSFKTMVSGLYEDIITGQKVTLQTESELVLNAGGYRLLVKK